MLKKIMLVMVLVSGLVAGECERYKVKVDDQHKKLSRALKSGVNWNIVQSELRTTIYYLDKTIVSCEDNAKYIIVRDRLKKHLDE